MLRRLSVSCITMALWASPALACQQPGNRVTNCGFDTGLSGWSLSTGTLTHQPSDGSSQAGSLQAAAGGGVNPTAAFEQCLTGLAPSTSYGFGVDARRLSGSTVTCTVLIDQYAGANCTPPSTGTAGLTIALNATWTQSQSVHTTAATTQSAFFTVTCSDGTQTFSVRFDDLFYGQGLVPVELSHFSVE